MLAGTDHQAPGSLSQHRFDGSMSFAELEFPPLIVLVGPTAVGKTAVYIQLAKQFDIELVSADSRLFYRGLDIGTAKPTNAERKLVPHHLIDVVDPDQPWSLADYRRVVQQTILAIHRRGKLPVLIGGTGQYVSAIVEGWQPPPRPQTDAYRQELEAYAEQEGSQALHSRLAGIDPASAARIDHRNIRRVIRALEIFEITGKPASELRVKQAPAYRILRLGLSLPRQQLYQRLDARLEAMLEAGWEVEVRRLLDQGYDFMSPAFSAIGYRQMAAYVRGEKSLDQVKQEIKRITRQFVRRQANWFKPDDARIHWFVNHDAVVDEISVLIRTWLKDAVGKDAELEDAV
ncbi:MAG: tRNA (adenosine(37)-N6)-dimethylallyltransferase MiaA [Anaerolineales bacterium]|nr:MAG: tRNA (adenosine(37)-N6)-dimethylallyltransferase MiaA [Anaerolineales bacterium]